MVFERYSAGHPNARNKCGEKQIVTITGHAARPIVVIGALLIDAGFDVRKRYDLLFDGERLLLGIEPTADKRYGLSVQKKPNQKGDKSSYMMSAVGFCKRFKLTDRYEALTAEWNGDMWVCQLVRR